MISYEDLCQALDRFNARRRNAAEMAGLENAVDMPAHTAAAPMSHVVHDDTAGLAAAHDELSAADAATLPFSTEEATDDEQQAVSDVSGFAAQPPEDTHEIDVDDVMLEDRLSDDKLPGD